MVFAESARARFATEKNTTDGGGFTATLMARVMRARPSVVTSDVLHGDADARRVNGNRAEIAAHDFAAVPARLAHRAVTVVATGNLRARLLGFRPRLELGVASFAHVHGRFPIFHVVIVRLQDGVTVYLNRRLRSELELVLRLDQTIFCTAQKQLYPIFLFGKNKNFLFFSVENYYFLTYLKK